MLKKEIEGIKEVLKRKEYLISFILISLIFYSLNILILSFGYFKENFLQNFPKLFFNLIYSVETYTFYSIIILSFLIGLFFSMLYYKIKQLKQKTNKSTGLLGSFIAITVPGCAACGVGVLALFGGFFSTILFLLPLKGFELSLLAIILLIYSIKNISKEIANKGICEIDYKNLKGGKMQKTNNDKYWKYGFFVLIVLVLIFAAYSLGSRGSYNVKTTTTETNSYSAQQNAEIQKFSECLADRGFEAYTADWCPHCENLKEYFGGDKNVEPFWIVCQDINRGSTSDTPKCIEQNIGGFPTLKLNGQELNIARTFDSIAQATGCPAPKL